MLKCHSMAKAILVSILIWPFLIDGADGAKGPERRLSVIALVGELANAPADLDRAVRAPSDFLERFSVAWVGTTLPQLPVLPSFAFHNTVKLFDIHTLNFKEPALSQKKWLSQRNEVTRASYKARVLNWDQQTITLELSGSISDIKFNALRREIYTDSANIVVVPGKGKSLVLILTPFSAVSLLSSAADNDVDPEVVNPELLEQTTPEYPQELADARYKGKVVFTGIVTVQGRIDTQRVIIQSCPAYLFCAHSWSSIKAWRFKPGSRHGQPVAVVAGIEISFNLR